MAHPVVVFTDRDGDQISVIPRNTDGERSGDPTISIVHDPTTKHERSQSVVFLEREAPTFVVKMVGNLHLTKDQIQEIIKGLQQSLTIADIQLPQACVVCKTLTTTKWIKCCAAHTSESGPDMVCHTCSERLHPDKINVPRVT